MPVHHPANDPRVSFPLVPVHPAPPGPKAYQGIARFVALTECLTWIAVIAATCIWLWRAGSETLVIDSLDKVVGLLLYVALIIIALCLSSIHLVLQRDIAPLLYAAGCVRTRSVTRPHIAQNLTANESRLRISFQATRFNPVA